MLRLGEIKQNGSGTTEIHLYQYSLMFVIIHEMAFVHQRVNGTYINKILEELLDFFFYLRERRSNLRSASTEGNAEYCGMMICIRFAISKAELKKNISLFIYLFFYSVLTSVTIYTCFFL
jgi:hypothetical protein